MFTILLGLKTVYEKLDNDDKSDNLSHNIGKNKRKESITKALAIAHSMMQKAPDEEL